MNTKKLIAIISMLGIVVIWGLTFPLVKDATKASGEFGVIPFLAFRFTIAALALTPFIFKRITWKTLLTGIPTGFVLWVGYYFQTTGLGITNASRTAIITGLFVVFAPIANRLLFGVKTSPAIWMMVALSIFGLFLLNDAELKTWNQGDLFVVVAALGLGVHVALLDRYAKGCDVIAFTWAQMFVVACFSNVVVTIQNEWAMPPSGEVWGVLLLTGIVASCLGFAVQTFAQTQLSAVQVSTIIVTEPLFGSFFGVWLHGNTFTSVQITGAVLMVSAAIGAEFIPLLLKKTKARKKSQA